MNKKQTILSVLLIVVMGMIMLTPVSAQDEENIRSHVVQPGETLLSIATRYGVTLESLLFYNDLTENSILDRGQLILIPPTGGTPVISGETETYTVVRGDTLYGIALAYNTTVDALLVTNTNVLNASAIRPGLVLTVPAQGGATEQADIGQGGGLSTQSTTTNLVQQQTTVVQQPVIVNRQVVNGYYHVQYGDTMLAIARSFNVDVWNIARANGIFNLNRIYAGQLLRIPGHY